MSTGILSSKPYTVTEAMRLLGFSRDTVIRMFEHEPGVLIKVRPETRYKRRRRTIRIPTYVLERKRRELEYQPGCAGKRKNGRAR
jgi:hypothetical protein